MTTCVGIDPGVHGGIAAVDGASLFVWRMPSIKVKVGRTQRPRVDVAGVLELARDLRAMGYSVARIEKVNGFSGQGGATQFVFGHAVGLVEMAFLAAGFELQYVAAPTWKAAVGARGDKGAARRRAAELWPEHVRLWPKAGDDGLIDAALIAVSAATIA